jgi:L-ascorbate metabolism protein UlaG (beta-lactamase superfamily)
MKMRRTYGLALAALLTGIMLAAVPGGSGRQDCSLLRCALSEKESCVWYLGHCGYAVKTKSKLLIFDYQEQVRLPDRSGVRAPAQRSLCNGWVDPDEIRDLDVLVFVSHSHSDHYDPVIFSWEKRVKKIAYIFGWKERDGGNCHSLPAPRGSLALDGVEIFTVNSFHAGVPESGFLVKLDGLTFFFQGDYIGRMGGDEAPLTVSDDLNYLKSRYDRIDLLFAHAGTWEPQLEMLESFRPAMVFPMHYGYREERYAHYCVDVRTMFRDTLFFAPQKKGDFCCYRRE